MKKFVEIRNVLCTMVAFGIIGIILFPSPRYINFSKCALLNPVQYRVPSGDLSRFSVETESHVNEVREQAHPLTASLNKGPEYFLRSGLTGDSLRETVSVQLVRGVESQFWHRVIGYFVRCCQWLSAVATLYILLKIKLMQWLNY